jgi:hypothetical protein
MLTKEHALKIKKKLKAKISKGKKNRPHDLATIYYGDVLIASFGIRRGSNKHAGHDHIPASLHASPHTCLGLAQCPVSREDWLQSMRDQGLIE